MPKRSARWLRGSLACVVLASFGALASVEVFVGSALLLLALGALMLMPVGEELDRRFKVYRKLTSALAVVFALSLPFAIASLGLLGAVTALVCFILVHRLLHQKQPRDYLYLLLMGFFVLLISCAQAPDASMGLAMLLFFVSSMAALIAFQFYAEHTRHDPSRVARSYGGPEAAPRAQPVSIAWPALGYGVLCAVIAVVLFLVLPRTDMGPAGGAPAQVTVSGGGGPMTLPARTQITEDPTPAFMAAFPGRPGGRYEDEKLWRCETGDSWTGRAWRRIGVSMDLRRLASPPAAEPNYRWDQQDRHRLVSPAHVRGELVHQRIEPVNLDDESLPALGRVKRVLSPGMEVKWIADMRDFSFAPVEAGEIASYDAWSVVEEPGPGELREAPSNYMRRMGGHDYSLLTGARLQQRTVALAALLTVDKPTVYDKVMAIHGFFQGNDFLYALDVTALPEEDTIDAFINDVRLGTCDHFATGMALMLRSQGIPARVVRGYRGGDWEEDAYTVRQNMAHMWVEVFFIGHGWVSFDPTPARPMGDGMSASRFRAWLRGVSLKAQLFWFRDIVNYRGGLKWETLRKAFFALGDLSLDDVSDLGELGSALLVIAVRFLVPLALLGAAAALLRLLLRKRGARRPEQSLSRDQRRAAALYRRLRKVLREAGANTQGKTAGDLLRETETWTAPETGLVREVLARYRLARFGRRAMPKADYKRLRAGIRRMKLAELQPDPALSAASAGGSGGAA